MPRRRRGKRGSRGQASAADSVAGGVPSPAAIDVKQADGSYRPLSFTGTADATAPIGELLALDWRRDGLLFGLTVATAFALYALRLNRPGGYVLDEVFHAFTALRLIAGDKNAFLWYSVPPSGSNGLYEWTHPALAKLLTEFGIILLGPTPAGWRVASAVFGAFGVGLCFALGRVAFNYRVGLVAAALLLVDGLWFVMSRTAMNDIFLATFLLLTYFLFHIYLRLPETRSNVFLWLTGAAAGLAFASKWSAAYPVSAIAVWAVAHEVRLCRLHPQRDWTGRAIRLVGSFVLLPAGIYVWSYTQMFALGDSWSQFIDLQRQMYHSDVFFRGVVPGLASAWWTWPLAHQGMRFFSEPRGDAFINVIAIGNPVVWLAFLPAIAVCLLICLRERSTALLLVLVAFLTPWLAWALAPRGTYLYYFLPSVPAGCLAVAYVLDGLRQLRRAGIAYLLAALAVFFFLYPLYAAWPLSPSGIAARYWLTHWHT